jgi:hypothetical protein
MLKIAVVALVLAVASGGIAAGQNENLCSGAAPVLPLAVFDTDARGLAHGLPSDRVKQLFADSGVTVSWNPPESPLLIIDYAMDYGGDGARLDAGFTQVGLRNIVKQANGNPVSYTFTFVRPILRFMFQRAPLHAGPSGVTNPPWVAVARAADGSTVAQVNEDEIRSYVNVPAHTFALAGSARIKSVTITGDDHKFDGQANAVLDSMGWCP